MKADVRPTAIDHFGFITLFSLLVLHSVPAALVAIKRRNVAAHRLHLIGVYVRGNYYCGCGCLDARTFTTTMDFPVALPRS